MKLIGKMYSAEFGAQRYVDAATDDNFLGGSFYIAAKVASGPPAELTEERPELQSKDFHDACLNQCANLSENKI